MLIPIIVLHPEFILLFLFLRDPDGNHKIPGPALQCEADVLYGLACCAGMPPATRFPVGVVIVP